MKSQITVNRMNFYDAELHLTYLMFFFETR